MRHLKATIAAIFSLSLLAAGSTADAQEPYPAYPDSPAIAPAPAPAGITLPFAWYGNALDQKILDAQAQMVPLRPVRHVLHRRHSRR